MGEDGRAPLPDEPGPASAGANGGGAPSPQAAPRPPGASSPQEAASPPDGDPGSRLLLFPSVQASLALDSCEQLQGVGGGQIVAVGGSDHGIENEERVNGLENESDVARASIALPVTETVLDGDIDEVGLQIDWDFLQIIEPIDEEGRLQVASDENLYEVLGLKDDDERAEKASGAGASSMRSASAVPHLEIDDDGAAIPVDDHIPAEMMINYDPDNPQFKLGTLFPSMDDLRIAVRQYAMNKEFDLRVGKTDKNRYDGYCKGAKNCTWHVHAKPVRKGSKTVIVTVWKEGHTCPSSSRRKTTTPSAKWVASKAVRILYKTPDMGVRDMQIKLQDDFNCLIGYDTVWNGVQKAMEELYGSWEENFGLLYNWKAEVMSKMPGSVIEIDVEVKEGLPYFHRFFCALAPCIAGFLEGCRPYLSIDSTALNGRWSGHLPAACSIDGHNWMYPVAYGLFDSETEDNWIWFMTQLHKAIGDLPLLAICTDACKGLENAVKYVFPMAEQRECFKHLMDNYLKRPFGGEEDMYPAGRAYRKDVHDHHISIVKENPEAKLYLETYHNLKWMRSAFNPAIKCDYVTNNIAEVFNKWIKGIKGLPVTELADKLREMLMVLWHKRRRIGRRIHGKILPAVLHVLTAQTRGLRHLMVTHCDDYAAQIVDISSNVRHVVKAQTHECSCEEWQHTGKPCQHALCLITAQPTRDINMENFVDEYYSAERFRNAYKRLIEPLPDKSQWPKVDLSTEIGAPLGKRSVGRQRKNRIKGALEGGGSKKERSNDPGMRTERQKKRIKGPTTCPNCGLLGHRASSYKCALNGTKKRKRQPRKNTTKNWFPKEVSTPNRRSNNITREAILQESPGIVTRRRLAALMEEGSSSQSITNTSTPTKQPTPKKKAVRKLTPKKKNNA